LQVGKQLLRVPLAAHENQQNSFSGIEIAKNNAGKQNPRTKETALPPATNTGNRSGLSPTSLPPQPLFLLLLWTTIPERTTGARGEHIQPRTPEHGSSANEARSSLFLRIPPHSELRHG
jgi:hypothetical protein